MKRDLLVGAHDRRGEVPAEVVEQDERVVDAVEHVEDDELERHRLPGHDGRVGRELAPQPHVGLPGGR